MLKLTKFGVATLIFGDIRPGCHQCLEKQPKYGNLLLRRHFAAKKRPTGDALAFSECMFLVTGRATAGIAINQKAILRFFALQGRHD